MSDLLSSVIDNTNDGGSLLIGSNDRNSNDRWGECADIHVTEGGVALFSVGEVPWHGMGNIMSRQLDGDEALDFSRMKGWELEKVRQYVYVGGEWKETDSWAIVRQDTGEVISTVGRDYEIVTNEQQVDFIKKVVGNQAVFETGGALGNGRDTWFLVEMPELATAIAGSDEIRNYVMFQNSHGKGSNSVFGTSVRTICRNTYTAAMQGRKGGWRFRHTKSIHDRMEQAAQDFQDAIRQVKTFNANAEVLAKKPLGDLSEQFFSDCLDRCLNVTIADQQLRGNRERDHKNVLDAIMTITDAEQQQKAHQSYEYNVKRRGRFLDEILNRHESERCNGNADIAGTVWSAVNAVSETAQHTTLINYKGKDDPKRYRENRFNSVVSGKAAEWTQVAVDTGLEYAGMVGA